MSNIDALELDLVQAAVAHSMALYSADDANLTRLAHAEVSASVVLAMAYSAVRLAAKGRLDRPSVSHFSHLTAAESRFANAVLLTQRSALGCEAAKRALCKARAGLFTDWLNRDGADEHGKAEIEDPPDSNEGSHGFDA